MSVSRLRSTEGRTVNAQPLKTSRALSDLAYIVQKDAQRYWNQWWQHRGFYTVLAYRVRRARKTSTALGQLVLLPIDVVTAILGRIASNAEIQWEAEIGEGFLLPHPQGVIIGGRVKIGKNVAVFQQVTLGSWNEKEPVVGDNVGIFAGAKVFGAVTIGDNAHIGANAAVSKSVPEWHVASGVPATNRLRSDAPTASDPKNKVDQAAVETPELDYEG